MDTGMFWKFVLVVCMLFNFVWANIRVHHDSEVTTQLNKAVSLKADILLDDEEAVCEVLIKPKYGTISLDFMHGLEFLAYENQPVSSGSADSVCNFKGRLIEVNSALRSVSYVPDLDFDGKDFIFLEISCGSTSVNSTIPVTVENHLERRNVKECPVINDKICNGRGNCHPVSRECVCVGPWFGSACENRTCDVPCLNGGKCSGSGVCSCPSGFKGDQCQYKLCPRDCNHRGTCDASAGICKCGDRFFGDACELILCFDSCSNHGVCNHSNGQCQCDNGYFGSKCQLRRCDAECIKYGGTCDYTTGVCSGAKYPSESSPESVPKSIAGTNALNDVAEAVRKLDQVCRNDCSGHGRCNSHTRSCECEDGYFDVDCSTRMDLK
eukprot:GILK01001990.1.p1 GENE.GILK01001990.1~~GILK01001990.1.p1  ORF type:complete len:393 (+),score=52.27 GILK01001990.1:38-1180(+)